MAARDPAEGQRDGLIPAGKGAPEQRPRPNNASVTAWDTQRYWCRRAAMTWGNSSRLSLLLCIIVKSMPLL